MARHPARGRGPLAGARVTPTIAQADGLKFNEAVSSELLMKMLSERLTPELGELLLLSNRSERCLAVD